MSSARIARKTFLVCLTLLSVAVFASCGKKGQGKNDQRAESSKPAVIEQYVDHFQEGKDAYRRGEYRTAVEHLRIAADQGNTDAQVFLGICYNKGQGVSFSQREAVNWWRKAAEKGNVDAQVLLATSYELGEGVEENISEAIRWYRRAADQGDSDARAALRRLTY